MLLIFLPFGLRRNPVWRDSSNLYDCLPSRRPWPIGLPPSRLGIAQAASRLALLSLLRRFIARFRMFVAIASCLVIGEPSGFVIIVPSLAFAHFRRDSA